MRHVALLPWALAISLLLTGAAFGADWDAKRVEKVAADLKAGKTVVEAGTLPKSETQVVTISVGESLTYVIDYKARICFATQGPAAPLAFVPCPLLKRGYPALAGLFGGEEGMRRQMPPAMRREKPGPGAPGPQGPPPREKE